MDIFTPAERSAVMALIRSRGNRSTELKLIAVFKRLGVTGWRRGSTLPGKPDFVFPSLRLAVFVDGCFWHGCPLHFKKPSSRRAFWKNKILTNRRRDRRVRRRLQAAGWRTLTVWEHDLQRKREGWLFFKLQRAGVAA